VGLDLLELNPKVSNINHEEVQIKGVGGSKVFLLRIKALKYPIKCTTKQNISPIKQKIRKWKGRELLMR
jgi:hypothetical protein